MLKSIIMIALMYFFFSKESKIFMNNHVFVLMWIVDGILRQTWVIYKERKIFMNNHVVVLMWKAF